jgi:hypothetical protein
MIQTGVQSTGLRARVFKNLSFFTFTNAYRMLDDIEAAFILFACCPGLLGQILTISPVRVPGRREQVYSFGETRVY